MATTWTQADLTALEEAIAQGVQEVEYNDRKVKYRSLNAMLQTRELIRKNLGLSKRGARILCEAKKGTV